MQLLADGFAENGFKASNIPDAAAYDEAAYNLIPDRHPRLSEW